MDYDLGSLLANKSNVFPEHHIKSYVKQLFMGLASLVKNDIVHRDLKSTHLFLCQFMCKL
mgnify:CR=1 FL=1